MVSCFVVYVKQKIMQVVSARDFRANQTKILTAARKGQTVMLTSRVGNFKIVPITDDDTIIEMDLRASMKEVKAHVEGKVNLPNARDIEF